MRKSRWFWTVSVLFVFLQTGWLAAIQPRSGASAPAPNSARNDEDLATTREHLIKLLRLSPKLTLVVSRDPSLLGNQEYVTRNNPELAQFLQGHPEVTRNPEFYLFADLGDRGNPESRLERVVWPEAYRVWQPGMWDIVANEVVPFLVFLVILSALLWLLRVLLENRRWSRMVKLQTEVHGKLLDRFANNQELLTYMNTDAGKRFLESAPVAVGLEPGAQARMSLTRVLLPLQLGVVLTLVGIGLLLMRNSIPSEGQTAMLFFGTLGLMLGIGFIISAGLAYLLAKRLGLLPEKAAALEEAAAGIVSKERL